MASLVDELNELLKRKRGEAEAIKLMFDELEQTDPDLLDGGDDILRTMAWSCSGLYHRISQLQGNPTTDMQNLEDEISDREDAKSKIEYLCKLQKEDRKMVKSTLKRDDVDHATHDFLIDMLKVQEDTTAWCDSKLAEWKKDK